MPKGRDEMGKDDMKKTFQAYLEYDLDYNGYVVDVPTLPGCMSQGKTKQEAQSATSVMPSRGILQF